MNSKKINRRSFLTTLSAGTVAVAAASNVAKPLQKFASIHTPKTGKLAALGGNPVMAGGKAKVWLNWPASAVNDTMVDELNKVLKSGKWSRIDNRGHGTVDRFEKLYTELLGVKGTVTTGSGTQALHTVVEALGFGPGDEIITSPYTDPGTISSIISARALPVMVDLDRESFQLDPKEVAKKINKNTVAIMPVHMMGQPADMTSIMKIARENNLKVIEDACQAHLAKFDGKILGSIGDAGCFSFQTSKTICCGEGGAIISNNEQLLDDCYTVMNHGTNKRGKTATIGPKYRMNEFEAAILLGHLPTAKENFETRNRNAAYLTSKLKGFKGLVPQKLYKGTGKTSWYLYPMAYHQEHWNNIPRNVFLKAMAAEGMPLSPYIANGLNKEPWTDDIVERRSYKEMYTADRLKQFKEDLTLPNCEWVCDNMVMLWASGPLLGTEKDMDDLINAIMKVHANKDELRLIS